MKWPEFKATAIFHWMRGCIGNIKIDELGYLLFPRYDSRVKAMEVDERPTEQYSDIGGLDQQIQEVNMINKQINKQDFLVIV